MAQTRSDLSFTQNTSLNIVLIAATAEAVYSGEILDGHGAGIPNVRMTLTDETGTYRFATTNSEGELSKATSPAEYTVGVWCYMCTSQDEYINFQVGPVDLRAGSISGVTLVVEDRVLTVTVTDEKPVAVEFHHAVPASLKEHVRIFGVTPSFSCPVNAIV